MAAAALYVLFGRLFEMVLPYAGLTGLIYAAALIAALLAGGAYLAVSHRVGRFLLGLYVWMLIALPFSVWKGGSFNTVRVALKSAAIYLVAAGLVRTLGDYRRAARAMAWAAFTLALLATLFGRLEGGRLTLDAGRFANPNDLANALLAAGPFCMFFAQRASGSSRTFRILSLAVGCFTFMTIVRTGSRGAMVGFAGAGLVFLWRSRNRVIAAVTLALVCSVGLALAPKELRTRYVTFFSPPEENAGKMGEAVESALLRRMVLMESVTYTFTHPVFGVGPGMFSVFQNEDARERGLRKGHWLVTHNTYTQISSECGLPAFAFYIAALIACVRITFRLQRASGFPGAGEITTAARWLNISLVTYAITSMFGSIGYSFIFPALAGLTVGLDRAAYAAQAFAPRQAPGPSLTTLAEASRPQALRPVG
jgi:hypothetical protein